MSTGEMPDECDDGNQKDHMDGATDHRTEERESNYPDNEE